MARLSGSFSCEMPLILLEYAKAKASEIDRAVNPPAGASGREKAVYFLIGFADVDAKVAARLLSLVPAVTDDALEDADRRDEICIAAMNLIAPASYIT